MSKLDYKKLSLCDALDLAILIEFEAQERYEQFAELVGSRYSGDAGDFFVTMAKNEAKHGKQLRERRQKLFGTTPTKVSLSDIWNVEAPEEGKPRPFLSVRQAMEIAMEAETKARDFFASALPQIADAEVKALFTELKGEEEEHQAALRKQMALLPPGDGPDLTDDDVDEPSAL